jgi:CheY-like chemotaxis protein
MAQHLVGVLPDPVDARPDSGGTMAVKRVLAVENNDLVLSFIELSLGTAGYEVDTAHNGKEALAKIDREAYDVIVSDVRMPEVDGVELCQELERRRSPVRQRMVLLSNDDTLTEHRAFLDASGVARLAKPVGLADLCGVVEHLIGPARD